MTGRRRHLEPRIQNLPVRTEIGDRLRRLFTQDDRAALISVDFSQIELRVMALLEKDKDLK